MNRRTATITFGAVAAALVVFILVLQRDEGPRTIATSAGVILVAASNDAGMDGGFESRLAFTANGCLGLAGTDEAQAAVVAIFPAGTDVVQTNPLTVRINGKEVKLGESFSGGGGEVQEPATNELLPTGPARCLKGPVFLVNEG